MVLVLPAIPQTKGWDFKGTEQRLLQSFRGVALDFHQPEEPSFENPSLAQGTPQLALFFNWRFIHFSILNCRKSGDVRCRRAAGPVCSKAS